MAQMSLAGKLEFRDVQESECREAVLTGTDASNLTCGNERSSMSSKETMPLCIDFFPVDLQYRRERPFLCGPLIVLGLRNVVKVEADY